MKLLLDECVTRLKAANGRFEVLVTKSIRHQQDLQSFQIAVLLLIAKTNRYEHLKPLVPQALEALKSIKPGTFAQVPAN